MRLYRSHFLLLFSLVRSRERKLREIFFYKTFWELLDDFPVRVFNEFFYELIGQGAVHIYPVSIFFVEMVGRGDFSVFFP